MKKDDTDFNIDLTAMKDHEDDDFSAEELELMHKSFDMVQDLKAKIDELKASKDHTQQDLKNLEKKVSEYEKKEQILEQKLEKPVEKKKEKSLDDEVLEFEDLNGEDSAPREVLKPKLEAPEPPISAKEIIEEGPIEVNEDELSDEELESLPQISNDHIANIKGEIIEEFKPIVDKLDMGNLRKDVLDDFKKIIDIEFNKLKSELDLQNTKDKRETVKKISDLEGRMHSSIKPAKDDFDFDSTQVEDLIETKTKEVLADYLKEASELESLKADLGERQNILRDELDDIKKNLNEFIDDYNVVMEAKNPELSSKLMSEDEKEEFKEYILAKVNDEMLKVDDKVKDLSAKYKNVQANISVERGDATEQELVDKVNEIIDNFNDFKEDNKVNIEELKLKIIKEVKGSVNDLIEDTKNKVAKQILSNNEFLTKLTKKNKDLKDKLNETVENKFLLAKKQFEDLFRNEMKENDKLFHEHIDKFAKEQKDALKNFDAFKDKIESLKKDYQDKLKEEKNYLQEFQIGLNKEKADAIAEFDKVKQETLNLIEDYQSKVNVEKASLEGIKNDFERDKKQFVGDIESNINAKKLEMQQEFDNYKDQFSTTFKDKLNLIENYDKKYEKLIHEKYEELVDISDKRLTQLEKKFVEKDFEYVKSKIDENLKVFQLYEEKLSSKEDEILNKIDYLNEYQESFVSEVTAEQAKIKEKIETRITGLEKSVNKRVLDYSSDFDAFKGTIIDEVEDLVKKVDTVLGSKSREIDTLLKSGGLHFEGESEVKAELKDLKAKMELASEASMEISLKNHVTEMNSYETQLINAIDGLRVKGHEDSEIKSILIKKGHPKFYITFVLNNM